MRVQATNCASSFEVTTDGVGVVGHAGAALLRELADWIGLTKALGWQQASARHRHPDAAVLRDLAVMLADGGDCLSDLAVLRDQPELFGPVASTPTAWRVLDRIAGDASGLARLRAARAHARARGWAAGGDPNVELLIIDADATLVLATATTSKARQAPTSTRLGSRRCWPTWTAGLHPGSRWPACCGRATPPPAPATTWSTWSTSRWRNCPPPPPANSRSWSAATAPGPAPGLAWHLRERGVGFSLGMQIDAHVREAITAQPEVAWTPAVDPTASPAMAPRWSS